LIKSIGKETGLQSRPHLLKLRLTNNFSGPTSRLEIF